MSISMSIRSIFLFSSFGQLGLKCLTFWACKTFIERLWLLMGLNIYLSTSFCHSIHVTLSFFKVIFDLILKTLIALKTRNGGYDSH